MNRRLRKRHRTMIVALAAITPALFVLGLSVRQSIPRTASRQVQGVASDQGNLQWIGADELSGELPIRVNWLRATAGTTRHVVGLELVGPVKGPDVLVYWDEQPTDDGDVSETARLLGRIGGRHRISWEVPSPGADGRLVFYSTAWKKVAGSVAPPAEWTASP